MKRNCRSETIIDKDDLQLLFILRNFNCSSEERAMHLDILKKKLDISHRGLLTHEKRLLIYGAITLSERLENASRFKGQKIKYLYITDKGNQILNFFLGEIK